MPLGDGFCVESGNVIIFEAHMSVDMSNSEDDADEFGMALVIPNMGMEGIVARSVMSQFGKKQNFSLLYKAKVEDEDTTFRFVLRGTNPVTIDPLELQVTYQIYGPDYPLTSTPGEPCDGGDR